MDTEGTYCAIVANPEYLSQWQGPNATYTMHLEVPCDTGVPTSLVTGSCPQMLLSWLALWLLTLVFAVILRTQTMPAV